MKYLKFIFFVSIISCSSESEIELPNYHPTLAVDGFIEDREVAFVALTNSVSFYDNLSGYDLARASELNALLKLSELVPKGGQNSTVFDTVRTETMILRRNKTSSFPVFGYYSRRIRGKVGGYYYLRIEIPGTDSIFEATTSIPKPVDFDTVWMEHVENDDFKLRGRLSDPDEEENYYRIFTQRANKDQRYIPMHYSTLGDQFFDGKTLDLTILRGLESFTDISKDLFFTRGDTILVKLTTIDREHFDFWRTLDSEIYAAGNPFASGGNEVISNVKSVNGHDVLGIFGGYARKVRFVVAQ